MPCSRVACTWWTSLGQLSNPYSRAMSCCARLSPMLRSRRRFLACLRRYSKRCTERKVRHGEPLSARVRVAGRGSSTAGAIRGRWDGPFPADWARPATHPACYPSQAWPSRVAQTRPRAVGLRTALSGCVLPRRCGAPSTLPAGGRMRPSRNPRGGTVPDEARDGMIELRPGGVDAGDLIETGGSGARAALRQVVLSRAAPASREWRIDRGRAGANRGRHADWTPPAGERSRGSLGDPPAPPHANRRRPPSHRPTHSIRDGQPVLYPQAVSDNH